jgi:signal transduction histidine kinase
MFSLGANVRDTRRVVLGLCLAGGVLITTIWTDPGEASDIATAFVFVFGIAIALPVFAGRIIGSQMHLSSELRAKNAELEATREERARAAVADERARIARELHDVVAHSVSVMVVQAGAARRVIDYDHERAAGAFGAIESTGRDALAEMRRLLGMLRPSEEAARLSPQPGIDGIEQLVERACAAGLRASCHFDGERVTLPSGVDLAAYRVVQEALTNAIKYAPGSRVEVAVAYGAGSLALSVEDDGRADHRPTDVGGAGHGLTGMRERVALYGGELDCGPRAEGGFAVHARLPLASGVAA